MPHSPLFLWALRKKRGKITRKKRGNTGINTYIHTNKETNKLRKALSNRALFDADKQALRLIVGLEDAIEVLERSQASLWVRKGSGSRLYRYQKRKSSPWHQCQVASFFSEDLAFSQHQPCVRWSFFGQVPSFRQRR